MGKQLIAAMVLVLALGACGGGGDEAPPDAVISICGEPGDEGNELGVGRYCTYLSDCETTEDARLCATLGDPEAHFCTRTCQSTDPDTVCGTGAECTCNDTGTQCGCTPTECL